MKKILLSLIFLAATSLYGHDWRDGLPYDKDTHTYTIYLAPRLHLVNISWVREYNHEDELWILTKKMQDDERPKFEVYEFKSPSATGYSIRIVEQ